MRQTVNNRRKWHTHIYSPYTNKNCIKRTDSSVPYLRGTDTDIQEDRLFFTLPSLDYFPLSHTTRSPLTLNYLLLTPFLPCPSHQSSLLSPTTYRGLRTVWRLRGLQGKGRRRKTRHESSRRQGGGGEEVGCQGGVGGREQHKAILHPRSAPLNLSLLLLSKLPIPSPLSSPSRLPGAWQSPRLTLNPCGAAPRGASVASSTSGSNCRTSHV